jgi:hypothetical protein
MHDAVCRCIQAESVIHGFCCFVLALLLISVVVLLTGDGRP